MATHAKGHEEEEEEEEEQQPTALVPSFSPLSLEWDCMTFTGPSVFGYQVQHLGPSGGALNVAVGECVFLEFVITNCSNGIAIAYGRLPHEQPPHNHPWTCVYLMSWKENLGLKLLGEQGFSSGYSLEQSRFTTNDKLGLLIDRRGEEQRSFFIKNGNLIASAPPTPVSEDEDWTVFLTNFGDNDRVELLPQRLCPYMEHSMIKSAGKS